MRLRCKTCRNLLRPDGKTRKFLKIRDTGSYILNSPNNWKCEYCRSWQEPLAISYLFKDLPAFVHTLNSTFFDQGEYDYAWKRWKLNGV